MICMCLMYVKVNKWRVCWMNIRNYLKKYLRSFGEMKSNIDKSDIKICIGGK